MNSTLISHFAAEVSLTIRSTIIFRAFAL